LRAGWRATGPGPLLRPPLAAQPVAEATFSLLATPAAPAAHTAAASAPVPVHSSQAPVQLMLALASEGAELQYLPQFGNGDGRLAGAEAVLCRKLDGLLVPWWRGGQALSAPTADPVLLNHWVLSKACRQAAAWARQGLATLNMVVPVSAEYLQHPGFVDGLCRVLDQTGLPPEQLTLAVGGRTLAHWQPALLPTLAECRRLGVRISLARLRAGDTLMGLLHRLPIDEIRIDGPLLAQVPGDAQAEATVRRIATLGRDLGLRVVAEGVQHGEQRRWLAQLHCDAFQGPLAGPALAAPAFEQLAASAAPTEPAVLAG
jgi:diguanylate cyclase